MKANKVHKRLAKIEALISDLTERYSKGAVQIREALQDAKAAFARVKEAVSSQTSSGAAKHSPLNGEKAAVKKAAVKTAVAAAAPAPAKKKRRKFSAAQREAPAERMRQRWAAKKKADAKAQPKAENKPKKPTPAPVQVATHPAAQVPMGK